MDDSWWHDACERMIREQIQARGLRDERVLNAMRAVPRHLFIAEAYRDWAYTDGPLPIEGGQTISQPYIVALMTSLLALPREGGRVLEIGTGSGYQTAILAHLAAEVYSVERIPMLSVQAARRLEQLSLENITLQVGDGSLGWAVHAPYDGIIVTAGAPQVPDALLAQLAAHGRLVIPVGTMGAQYLECWRRCGKNFHHARICPVAFVPLIGAQGWSENVTGRQGFS
ncbi:MAG: protein-L-isoaspartate(D-aspartate) O-methyltransferase [Anaerolineales bacterium]